MCEGRRPRLSRVHVWMESVDGRIDRGRSRRSSRRGGRVWDTAASATTANDILPLHDTTPPTGSTTFQMAAPAAAQNLRASVLGGYRRLMRLRKRVRRVASRRVRGGRRELLGRVV